MIGERTRELLLAEEALSEREEKCLYLYSMGYTDAQIGDILGISGRTAKWHLDNVKRKLGAVSRAHALAIYLRKFIP